MLYDSPVGVVYLARPVDCARHTLRIADLMVADNALSAAEAALRGFQPKLIGWSRRNSMQLHD
jgi:hypothetical protein